MTIFYAHAFEKAWTSNWMFLISLTLKMWNSVDLVSLCCQVTGCYRRRFFQILFFLRQDPDSLSLSLSFSKRYGTAYPNCACINFASVLYSVTHLWMLQDCVPNRSSGTQWKFSFVQFKCMVIVLISWYIGLQPLNECKTRRTFWVYSFLRLPRLFTFPLHISPWFYVWGKGLWWAPSPKTLHH